MLSTFPTVNVLLHCILHKLSVQISLSHYIQLEKMIFDDFIFLGIKSEAMLLAASR